MEMTFLTMHDLSPDATVLYASDSIEDVLGYQPVDVVHHSCFEYFHPEELPFARDKHGESIQFDNAAVLAYCRLKNKQNEWIKCECVFTVVYDVFIAATTLYKRDHKSDGRAQAAPTIQRHFERPGPLDPRYGMIAHLAPKFRSHTLARQAVHEPRAAFLLNRFSQTLPILYATHAAQTVLDCNPHEAVGRSFYEYIDEEYLLGATNAIERAKGNDSIAYLRLRWKSSLEPLYPRQRHVQLPPMAEPFEVECLLSASSDGLVVVVRRAPPLEPHIPTVGIYASPWALEPLPPSTATQVPDVMEDIPPGPDRQEVMNSIRDVSVFAWSIAMLNSNVSNDNASNLVDGEIYPNEQNIRAPDEERHQ